MKPSILMIILLFAFFSGCSQTDDNTETVSIKPYFPPTNSEVWESVSPESLNWNTAFLPELKAFLDEKNTDAFIILKNGRIVVEYYYNDFTSATPHEWNSAGKTLTAFTTGMALQDGYLSLDDSTTEYLGLGWTVMTSEQEAAITIRHQLTMTSGGDYNVADTSCIKPECLQYLNEPGSFWFYHNAFYTLLQPVMDVAIPEGFDNYFSEKLKILSECRALGCNLITTVYFLAMLVLWLVLEY